MEKYAITDYVLIYQHDHVIEKVLDLDAVVDMMKKY